MSITSTDICQAADALKGFVGFNRKTGRYIVRFSEDSFGMDVADDSITPTSEFVWSSVRDDVMRLGREQLQILLEQNIAAGATAQSSAAGSRSGNSTSVKPNLLKSVIREGYRRPIRWSHSCCTTRAWNPSTLRSIGCPCGSRPW